MNEVIIPPSPSWYLGYVMACNDDGSYLAYGAKHELVIFKINHTPDRPLGIYPSFISMAHKERINAIAFSPSLSEVHKNRLVSASDDGHVRIWDCETRTLLFSHSGHPEGQKLPCVDWSRADPNLVVSASESGSLVSWDLVSNTIRRLVVSGSKLFALCLVCCPHNKNLIAIGAKAGLIIVYNLKGDGTVVFRIRGHESDVISLAWCPEPHNIFRKDKSEKALLLASGSKDKAIYFWRTGTDGRFEATINLPNIPLVAGYRGKNGLSAGGNSWICIRWPETYTLITSSLCGELLAYNLHNVINSERMQEGGNKKHKNKGLRLIHGNHTKGLFSIACPTIGDEKIVWTCAVDKHIVASKLNSSEVCLDITAIGGIVYCLAISPLDPNRVAIGVGDSKLLVWNISNGSCDNITTFWNKINSKVMALAWHPSKDSVLAFSTGEGRVGVLDVSTSKPPIMLRLHHRRSVYSIIWAPPITSFAPTKSRKWDLALFSVGDGEIVQYDVETPEKEPEDLGSRLAQCDAAANVGKTLSRTDLAWNHDLSLAAIGNDNGIVFVVDGKDFTHCHTYFAHKKLVQCLIWHPATVTSENEKSPNVSWLASAGDNIQVIDVSKDVLTVVASFSTHTEKVVSLAWSPHFNGRLFSASYDYTCQVWDVISGTLLACYDGHHNAVLCCLPSPVHPDIVITGSADSSVHVWNMNRYVSSLTPKSKKQRLSGALKKFSGVQEATTSCVQNGSDTSTRSEQVEAPRLEGISDVKPHKNRSMFPVLSNTLTSAKNLDILWARLNGEESSNETSSKDLSYLDFFGDSKTMRKLLCSQAKHHQESGHAFNAHQLSLWSGNLVKTLKEACEKKRLSEWMINLAPMVSHKMWMDCCASYADQLAAGGEALKASSYYVALHKIEEAVDVLIGAKLVREAVALAKARLPPSDPTVVKALVAWAEQANSIGNLNLTAHCYLAAEKKLEAVDTLARSKEAGSLSLAAQIANTIDSKEMAVSLTVRSVTTSLANSKFNEARDTLEHFPDLQELSIWVNICQLVIENNSLNPEEALEWICGKENDDEGIFEEALKFAEEKPTNYDLLARYIPNILPSHSTLKVWLFIGGQVTLAVAAYLDSSLNTCLKHLLNSLNAAYNCIFQNPAEPDIYMQFSARLMPKGPLSEIEKLNGCEKTLLESVRTFIACSAVYWLDRIISQNLECLQEDLVQDEVYKIIETTASLVLIKDILTYFKNNVEIKKMESSITAAKLNIPVTIKYCADLEAELCNKIENESEKSKTLDGIEEEKTETDDNTVNSDLNTKNLEILTEMKNFNKQFEDERCFAPNPIVMYCNLENVIQSLKSKKETELGNKTLKAVIEMWKAISIEN